MSRMMPSKVNRRENALVERFVFDYARHPELPCDVPPHRTLLRARAANLALQAHALRQPWESETVEAWRRRTAAQALVRIARLSSAARQIVRQTVATVAARSRESAARRSDTATARAGDSGDREPQRLHSPKSDVSACVRGHVVTARLDVSRAAARPRSGEGCRFVGAVVSLPDVVEVVFDGGHGDLLVRKHLTWDN
jgi:hypothetical protein